MLDRLLGILLLLTAAGCLHSRSSVGRATDAECLYDEDELRACRRQGRHFYYGPIPYVYCSGVAPDPDESTRHSTLARSSPCTCIDERALAERRALCAQVP